VDALEKMHGKFREIVAMLCGTPIAAAAE